MVSLKEFEVKEFQVRLADEKTLFGVCCEQGFFEMARCLHSLGLYRGRYVLPLRCAFERGNFVFAQWVYEVSQSALRLLGGDFCPLWSALCQSKHFEMAQWFYDTSLHDTATRYSPEHAL